MTGIKDYSTTPAANTALFPEGMAPSAVNDGMRQVQADLRQWYNDAQWAIYGDGDGAFTVAYVSPTAFSINGADVTAVYHAGRRVKAVGALTGTIYGAIASAAFATNTTVNVTWDSGSLQNEALTIHLGIVSASNSALPPASAATPGAIQLATQAEIEAGGATAKAVTPAGLAAAAMTWLAPHVFRSTDAGAGEIAALDLDRASASPAAGDLLMALRWLQRDSGGGTDVAAKIVAKLLDPTAGSEDAELQFATLVAGALAARLVLGQGLYTPNAPGGDKGPDSINAGEVYSRGNALGYRTIATQAGATCTLVQNDLNATVKFTNAGGCVVTLPSIASVGAGWRVRLLNASGGNVTVTRAGTDPIDGGGTAVILLNAPGINHQEWWTDGANWYSSTRWYDSGEQTIASSNQTTLAHGLGGQPKVIQIWLRCKTAQASYAPNDEIMIGNAAGDHASVQRGISIQADGTNFIFSTTSNTSVFSIVPKGGGAYVALANANWRIIIRAAY